MRDMPAWVPSKTIPGMRVLVQIVYLQVIPGSTSRRMENSDKEERRRGEKKDTLLRRSPLWTTENQSSWEQPETGRTYILTIFAKGWKANPSLSAYDRLSHMWAKRNPQMESQKCLQSYPATDIEFWMSKQSKDGTNNIC